MDKPEWTEETKKEGRKFLKRLTRAINTMPDCVEARITMDGIVLLFPRGMDDYYNSIGKDDGEVRSDDSTLSSHPDKQIVGDSSP